MIFNEYTQKSEQIQAFFGEHIKGLSRATGFVRRQSKLSGLVFVQAVVLSWLERPTGSLNEIRQSCAELGVVISEAGLQQRMTAGAVELLRTLFQRGLRWLPSQGQIPEQVLNHFSAIYLLDSTTLRLPERLKGLFAGQGGNGPVAAAKIRLSFEYRQARVAAVEVVAGREADQTCQQHVALAHPGSLHLFDLGFFKQQVFADLAQAGAYFISRLQTQTAVYLPGEEAHPLDLDAFLRQQAAPQGEVVVRLGRLAHLPVRLIFQRLPDAVVAERRRKAKRQAQKEGRTCSARHLNLLAWSLFITNVSPAWLTAQQVILVYPVRWQIELVFKLWKSQAKLQVVGACGPHRFGCQLYARLLGLLLFQWLLVGVPVPPQRELSAPKAFALVQRCAASLRLALAQGCAVLDPVLDKLTGDFQRYALKQQRRKSPSTLARLLAAGA